MCVGSLSKGDDMTFITNIKLRVQASRQDKLFVRQMEQNALPPPPPPPMIFAERLLHPGVKIPMFPRPTSQGQAGRGGKGTGEREASE